MIFNQEEKSNMVHCLDIYDYYCCENKIKKNTEFWKMPPVSASRRSSGFLQTVNVPPNDALANTSTFWVLQRPQPLGES